MSRQVLDRRAMSRCAGVVRSALLWAAAFIAGPASAEEPPRFFAVTGVAANDVLNLRDVPHGDSRKLGAIPPGARGLKNFGCLKPEPSLERWMGMTDAEKRNARLEWCRVEYHGRQGWVAARFLKPDLGAERLTPNKDAERLMPNKGAER
jgi:hypothetical protein